VKSRADRALLEPSPPPVRRISARQAVAAAYVVAVFLSAMDIHIVNVALPTLTKQFHTDIGTLQWVVTGYILGLAMFIPASGWLGDRFGTKRTFIAALFVFTAASALCGLAQNLPELIIFRIIQGAGGGTLQPVSTTILYREYPPAERAHIARLLMVPIVISPAIAPALAGLLIEKLSWRWIFFINIPIGIIGLAIAGFFLVEHRESPEAKFDLRGFLLAGSGLSLLLFAISDASINGWTSSTALISVIGAIICMVAFFLFNWRTSDPILHLRTLTDRLFWATNVVMNWNMAAYLGVLYLVPQFLQEIGGRSPLNSGLTTFVEALGIVTGCNTLGRLYARIGPRRLATASSLIVGVLISWFALATKTTSLWAVRGMLFTSGFIEGAALIALQASMFTNITAAETGHASAVSNTQRQVSVAIGIAVLSAILNTGGSTVGFYQIAFLTAAGMAIIAGLCSIYFVRDHDARASMVPHRRSDHLLV